MKNENENDLVVPDLSGLGEVGTLLMALADKVKSLEEMILSKEAKVIPSNYLTVAEAAEEMKVSDTTIYRLIKEGGLKTLGGFRHKRITRASFDNYLRLVTT